MTSIYTYNGSDGAALPELPPLPIGPLAAGAADLLQQAADLPQPRYVTISEIGQAVGLQFDGDPSSLRAITRWTIRFGGVVISQPYHDECGPQTSCQAKFDYYGIAVTAYAYIPAGTAST